MDRALDLPYERRADYVARAGVADPAVSVAATALLSGGAPDFLDSPAVDFAAPFLRYLSADSEPALAGAQFGPYRVLREIGHGGMGTVYLAERADRQYRKTVALKLVRGWGLGSEGSVRRFLEERQILAALDHPGIARLLDGGVTADGLPWFAMEYVEGSPIDRYCAVRRPSIESRLALFCRVCAAVQYAHRNLVVHRDLKPANILVTAEGAVKLLDFGIARLLGGEGTGEAAWRTATAERLLTPLYASPEQIRGEPVSTSSDVYSLGVILYQLLTGRFPYRLAGLEPHQVVRAVLDEVLERPSAAVLRPVAAAEQRGEPEDVPPAKLARRLRGDLDTIVLTAMHRDPGRRYGTAERLEADVRRHLAGLPVSARPDSRRYRAQKFVRRHRVGVAVAASVAVLVVGFAVVTAGQSVRIRRQAVGIARERDRAEQVSRFLAGLFQAADPFAGTSAGSTARELLDSGASRVDRELPDQPAVRSRMMLEMARAYLGLGARDRARRFAELALAIRRRSLPAEPAELAQALDLAGLVRLEQGELDQAEQAYREGLALRRASPSADARDEARSLNGLAAVLRAAGRFRGADSVSRQAVVLDEAAAGSLDLAETLKGLAEAVRERGANAEAERLYRRALTLERQSLPAEHPRVVGTLLDLAASLADAGDPQVSDSLFRQGLALERRALGDEHPEVATHLARYARLLRRMGKGGEADSLYRRALAIQRRRLPAVHPMTATTLLGLGQLLLDRGAAEQAEPLLREAYAMRRTALPLEHPGVAEAGQALGAVLLAGGRYLEAERYLLMSRDGLRAAFGDADPRSRAALARLAALYEAAGQPREAAAYRAELSGGRPPSPARPPSAPPVMDTGTAVVLPFRIIGDQDPALADLRDFVQDLLAARLTGEASPRALDPIVVQRSLRRAGPASATDSAVTASLRMAEQLGSRWLLRGEIAGTTRRVSLNAELRSVTSGEVLAEARAEGSADSLPHLVDGLAAHLLAAQAARDPEEREALLGTSLAALRAYLAGREAFRRDGSGSSALEYLERAWSLDTTFTPAAVGLVALGTLSGLRDERWKLDAAWRLKDRMTPPDRVLLAAYLGPRFPRPATAVELIAAALEATRAAPQRLDSWYVAGDYLVRYGSAIGYPGWETQAAAALEHGFSLDTAHAPTLAALIPLAVRMGDRGAMRRYSDAYLASYATAHRADQIRWLRGVVLGDSVALAAVRSRFSVMVYTSLMQIVQWSQQYGIGMDDGERAADAMLRRAGTIVERTLATRRVVPFLLNVGRPGEASRLLAASDGGFGERYGVGVQEFRIYAALYWHADSADALEAARWLEAYAAGGPGGLPEVWNRESAGCALTHWRAERGDLVGARAALRRLERPRNAPGAAGPPSAALCRASAVALVAARSADAGSSVALTRLDAALRAGTRPNDLLVPVANLVAARLYEARGDPRRALEAVRRRGGLNDLLSTQLREEGRLAAVLGDHDGAVHAYRHYLALGSNPEPALEEEREQVRGELARLERESAEQAARWRQEPH